MISLICNIHTLVICVILYLCEELWTKILTECPHCGLNPNWNGKSLVDIMHDSWESWEWEFYVHFSSKDFILNRLRLYYTWLKVHWQTERVIISLLFQVLQHAPTLIITTVIKWFSSATSKSSWASLSLHNYAFHCNIKGFFSCAFSMKCLLLKTTEVH